MTDALARHAAERILDAAKLLSEAARRNAQACKLNDTTDVERDDTLALFAEMRELFAGARRAEP